ncbi:isocitrate lyase/PEP mutase family protein [Bacillus glycinifermentans]|uniref:isocitrate lyase/PEP mutase family protein n=1 Tax=Bacillus glycinifermentans TaxID=1664069 RepID=UPI001FF20BE5|nr:isocitrate lyase/phosphoenolpyruvate mutase family protein [Bacillus glycinifermentans]UOY87875.1 isocitrate lyase/phosphoenolpyruvate mutase family protein [Bacillus glycinifermentans]
MKQLKKFETFQHLHHQSAPFVLPNAWDAGSAAVFERTGFKAVGTTSAGIAMSLGYKDGEHLPFETLLDVLTNIAGSVAVPVSADIEAGYGTSPEEISENVQKIAKTGVVGINIEDGTGNPEQPLSDASWQAEKIAAVKKLDLPLFINARTDLYWLKHCDPAFRLQSASRRANIYREAGADCIFVPGAVDTQTIHQLRNGISGPLNVLAGSGTPSVKLLSDMGIERISLGSGPFRASLTLLKTIGEEIISRGSFRHMTEGVLSYDDAAEWIHPPKK